MHIDFLYMDESRSGEKYVLYMKLYLSGYGLLQSTVESDAVAAKEKLTNCFTAFRDVKYLVGE